MMDDEIQIRGLRVSARIGVPEAERAKAQELSIDLRLFPKGGLSGLEDRIDRTIDYAAVAQEVREFCEQGSRALIETLAEDLATLVLQRHDSRAVEVLVRKFILPDCDYVAVRIRREAQG